MNQNKLFNQTRGKLALSYAIVMGFILSLLGFGVYRGIAHTHLVTSDRELKSVAGTLHDSLEWKLKEPGRVEPIIGELLPNLCIVGVNCSKPLVSPQRHILSAVSQAHYYIRLFDTSGRLIAIAGTYPEGLPQVFNQAPWQTLSDGKGNSYHQISLSLHTQDQRDWGYLQVGHSFQYLKEYLNTVKLILVLGLPMAMILVGSGSWWLAGLAMQPIYQSYRQIQQFTADAAHELRTPIAATLATVESALLMPSLDQQEARNILEIVERQNQRLTQLVADLLLLSRLDRQPASVRHQTCCLNDLVSDLVEELAALAIASEITLTSSVLVPTPLEVVGDSEQLYRLVSNLIINGIQYTPVGGKVTVILDKSDQHAVIQVEDTGIGIAQEDQGRIFDRFYRVNSDRSRHTGGSGLGLAIANAIAIAHHGSLQVYSERGVGSRFTLRLPKPVTSFDKEHFSAPVFFQSNS
ncbi:MULTISPECIES: two-component system sensor histidine kinase RppB [Moorena]|uniref:histidine kinase n=1 Tax=Moorena producens 3L TaxID=489825 RepID=F4XUG9_9CYAN|nr:MULTISPECIES: two-component system sensor histidine kinase RppB [Moorena]NEQ14147.1 two-component sensor histidine kinase [Moorena sp. SIO3E2]EGJ31794.1 histidine kinase [Moorena producens 3L]NEP66563.1 two-component sensor histidine kinase [Moorena sp. SIO3A5]NEQ05637.1 two-component sensor histidine kinase [Moorena sp. SIO4E2]NER86319.1 two-component sensor histidine kinase [Moorena sp. SIO3A2]